MTKLFKYVNMQLRNMERNTTSAVVVRYERSPKIFDVSHDWVMAVDRFFIKKAFLPLYKDTKLSGIAIHEKDPEGEGHALMIDFSPYTDSNKFLYSHSDFTNALNDCIDGLEAMFSGTVDFSSVRFSMDNGKLVLRYNEAFYNNYNIYFDSALYADIPSFPYETVKFDQSLFQLTLSPSLSITTHEALHISPVHKIYCVSQDIPVDYEYVSNEDNNPNRTGTDGIITDFNYIDSSSYPVVDIQYIGTTGQYRWHSMNDAGVFSRISINFYWKAIDGASYPVYIKPSGFADIKLVFMREFD